MTAAAPAPARLGCSEDAFATAFLVLAGVGMLALAASVWLAAVDRRQVGA